MSTTTTAADRASLLDSLRWKKLPVLDDGFVALVDCMGDDGSVEMMRGRVGNRTFPC